MSIAYKEVGGGGEGGDGWHVGLQLPIDRAEVDVGSTLAPHTFLLKPLRGPTSSPVIFHGLTESA